ncbi:hypothetical protein An04g10330 [Aspergillus niger]|uniref:Uncharacterized protein n=2 Tax=Aspergillus niger TaxID=5061 RepID=A2QKE4_ASPNC|nr:hypothetical protein An04g10330 [Aspergillus niger]CAK44813.1 hypothetical protein An04g10330 [Aspergillus niger]
MTYPAQADRILVMTTNAIGQLARAPLRSGRVNLKGGRFVNVSRQPTLSRREIILSNLLSSHNAPSCRYRAAEVQNYLLQYTSRALEAVKVFFTSLGKPQLHFYFDTDCEEDLSSFYPPGSPDVFMFNGQIYSIWVNVAIFSRHRASNDKANNQVLILLQHASKDLKSGYWDTFNEIFGSAGNCVI